MSKIKEYKVTLTVENEKWFTMAHLTEANLLKVMALMMELAGED